NDGAQHIKGYAADEIIGKHFSKFYPPGLVREGFTEKILSEAAVKGRFEHEGWRVRKDGSQFWADVVITAVRNRDGQLLGFVKVTRDLTERKETEEMLRKSEERYRTLFESIDEGFCIIEMIFDDKQKPVDYRFLQINPSFEKQTGLRDALGKTMRELAPQHEEHWFEIYGRVAMTGEPTRFQNRAEQLHRTFDVYAFRFGNPKDRQVAILFNDITKSKETEAQIVQLNMDLRLHASQLEVANKELESFSYSVSHDLRAPLRHIDGFVKLLDKQANGHMDDRSRRYLDIIADSARRMGALIDDLLVFSRMGRSEMRRAKVESRSLVDEVINSLQSEIRDRKIIWKIGELPQIEADAAMWRQVWANLIGNAVKYSRPRNPAEIEIGCNAENGEAVFFIRDNGVG
ncbi:MAG TPA: PAS domain S-box protein, partial [Candidatus Baltobacteraceae bacterium]|nr:PAS domain S-box protein [Candidatus Baltobacteraceae bacterium]